MRKAKLKYKKLHKHLYVVYEVGSRRVYLTLTKKNAKEIVKRGY